MKRSSSSKRTKKKRRLASKYSILKIGGFVALIALVVFTSSVGAGYISKTINAFISKTRFSIYEVSQVRGNKRVDTKEIIGVANVPLGVNLMQLDLDSVSQKILAIASIKDVKLSRNIPNGIEISVQEREPVACIQNKPMMLSDIEGVVFPSKVSNDLADYPMITGVDIKTDTAVIAEISSWLGQLKVEFPRVYNFLNGIEYRAGKIKYYSTINNAIIRFPNNIDRATIENLDVYLEAKGGSLPEDLKYLDLTDLNYIRAGTVSRRFLDN